MPYGLEKPLNMSVASIWASLGGNVSPSVLARSRNVRRSEAAKRGRNALRSAVNKFTRERKTQATRQISFRKINFRKTAEYRNAKLAQLIREANKLYNAAQKHKGGLISESKQRTLNKYHTLRNKIMITLASNNKTQYMKNILKNISRKKNNYYLEGINTANKVGRWNTWRGLIAAELGAGPKLPSPVRRTRSLSPAQRRGSPVPQFIINNRAEYNRLMRMAAMR